MKSILAIAYGGGHIACLLPVVERLRARGDRVELLALTTAASVCAARGIAHRRFADFAEIQDARSRVHGERLAGDQPANAAVPRAETVAYLGANYRDLEDAIGADAAATRFAGEGRQCFLPVASLTAILRSLRPDVVLATSAPRAERAAVIAARSLGIPTVVVVDLFGMWEDWLVDAAYGDAVCVLSTSVKERLVAAGRPAMHITVTGNPAFDRLGDPTLRLRGLELRAARGWSDHRVVTWASQPEPDDPRLPRRIEEQLIAALPSHPDWQLVLRPHPSDSHAPPAAADRLAISTREDDLHTLLAASDAVVTMTSTVGLEAVIAGKPLVTWDRSQNTRYCPYSEMGLSRGVTELSALPSAIAEALAGGIPKPSLPPVGGSGERVVAVIDRVAP